MTIHEITTQGKGNQLGPITVTKTFPSEPGKPWFFLCSDVTGKSAVKVWDPPTNVSPYEGMTITLVGQGPKGGLVNQEYPSGSGKWTINANSCRVDVLGAGQAVQQQAQTMAHEAPTAGGYQPGSPVQAAAASSNAGSRERHEAVMRQIALDAVFIHNEVLALIGGEALAVALAANVGASYPLYWFGEKGI